MDFLRAVSPRQIVSPVREQAQLGHLNKNNIGPGFGMLSKYLKTFIAV